MDITMMQVLTIKHSSEASSAFRGISFTLLTLSTPLLTDSVLPGTDQTPARQQ